MKRHCRVLFTTGLVGCAMMIAAFLSSGQGAVKEEAVAAISVRVTGFRNDLGIARIAIFTSAEGFPENTKKAYKTVSGAIENGEYTAVFGHVPFGVYAVSAYHDANDNGKLDKKWFRIPVEGYGASNNKHAERRGPEFDESRFDVSAEQVAITIELRYLFDD